MWRLIPVLLLGGAMLARAEQADELRYQVREEGAPGYLSRILVTDAFVRLDEGEGSANGYTLYNRVSHVIYNVDPQERTVLVLEPPQRQPRPPDGLRLEARLDEDPQAPAIDGRRPRRLELFANGRLCRTLQVVPGLMPRAVQGLRELRLALARLQGGTPPAEGADPCELAEYLYAPTRALEQGLPLTDLMAHRQQWLVGFEAGRQVPEGAFEVPVHYEQVVPPPLSPR